MGVVFFIALLSVRALAAGITFPLDVKWVAALPATPAFAPAFDSDQAYVSLSTNQLVAVQIKDGATVWSVECPMSAAPAAGDGLVFAGSDGLIEARSKRDGRAQWRRPITGKVTSLYWDTGWLLASTETGPLLAIRATDGEIMWQRDLGASLQAAPAPAGDRVYLPLKDGRVVALSLTTGEEIWTHKLSEAAAGILPVGDRVFVNAHDNHLHALETKDADTDWKWPTGSDLLGLPVLDEKRVYFVALDNVLRGHNRNNGTMEWKRVLPMRPFTGPLLSGQTLIMAGIASELRGYDTSDGKQVGEIIVKGAESEEMLLAAPPYLTSQDLVILLSRGGQMRALGSSSVPAVAPSEAGAPTTPPSVP
ncbi:MAG TPA: PQQ-binding-like beta-propeller repeat protein [Vicinamibacterales bacterium]|nr:PQQ-binding-like beta-propeller repeat protein [Vicinamibacterales bacterium]